MGLSKNYQKRLILVVVSITLLLLPCFIRSQHWLHVLILAVLESIVVMGLIAQYKVKLVTFCSATFWGIGAYISGLLSTRCHFDFWLCLPLSAIGTAVIALILGLVVLRAGWVTFLMLSIVIAEVFVEAIGHLPPLGGWDGITGVPYPAIGSFVFLSKTSYYYLTIGLFAVCVLIFYAFYRSPIGTAWLAIGQSSDLAASIGVNLFRYRMAAYVAAGFTSGLSGSLYAHYSSYLVPNTFDILRSLYMSISGVIGGMNFVVVGPVVGSFVMKGLPELLRITDKYEPIFVGVMIILCALFFRKGVVGMFSERMMRALR